MINIFEELFNLFLQSAKSHALFLGDRLFYGFSLRSIL